jgi:hypothetical protein
MRSISGGEKTDPDATIKSRHFVFWFNLALTLAFSILTACFYERGIHAVYPGGFFAAIYAFCTLVLGVRIYKARGGFFSKPKCRPPSFLE